MKTLTSMTIFCLCFGQLLCDYDSYCMQQKEEKLDDLIVTWSFNLSDPLAFNHLPKTIKEAEAQNWTMLDDGCQDSSSKHVGKRYLFGDDVSVLIIYDGQGHAAGFQFAVSKDLADVEKQMNYSQLSTLYYEKIKGKDRYVLTLYFINPDTICVGRSDEEVAAQGTSTQLYIWNGTGSYFTPPMTEDNSTLAAQDWFQAICVPSMGNHYFHNGDGLVPYFIVYNCGRLHAVQLFMVGNVAKEPRYEHVPTEQIKPFIVRLPDNLNRLYQNMPNGCTTLHVYFSREPQKVLCPP